MKRILLLCLVVLFITGCLPWARTGGPFTAPAQNVSVDLPDGWMRKNTKDYLLVTRDGPLLQYIIVENIHATDALYHTKKKFRTGMLPQEQAEVIIDNTSSNPEILKLKIISNKPTKINGYSGFKVVYTYKDKNGLQYKSMYYGFMNGEWFYGIRYNAPRRHYYNKELNSFKKVVKSLKLIHKS